MSEATPDPLETVVLLKSDFELLQAVADAAMEDFRAICGVMGIVPDPADGPRDIVYGVIMPRLAQLVLTQRHVDEASEDLRAAAARHGNKTLDTPMGRAALVGKRIPGLLQVTQLSRSERRRIEREQRHG